MTQLDTKDRLYNLLPALYRTADAAQGEPLRNVLRLIDEQLGYVEADMLRLYDNWFIETCQDWVVPYIGDLVGYEPVNDSRRAGEGNGASGNRFITPRREVASTVANRRRKGTLALLESVARQVSDWSARAVEFAPLMVAAQSLRGVRPVSGGSMSLRNPERLELLGTPFDPEAHTLQTRSIGQALSQGRYNLPNVGLFVWRLKSYSHQHTQARSVDRQRGAFTFSILGNDMPLYTLVPRDSRGASPARRLDVPAPISRKAFELFVDGKPRVSEDYYGEGKSIYIWRGDRPIPAAEIIPANLSGWSYAAPPGYVLVDPELGRFVFDEDRDEDVFATYHYGFAADIGGGEYARTLSQPADAVVIGVPDDVPTVAAAIDKAFAAGAKQAVIEIRDSTVYEEPIRVRIKPAHSLQIRAASGKRPTIIIPDRAKRDDAFSIELGADSRIVLDGLTVAGRGLVVKGPGASERSAEMVIRHCTLTPGWGLTASCEPVDGSKPSIELEKTNAIVRISHSIVGSIWVLQDEVRADPLCLCISDSIVDATGSRFSSSFEARACHSFHAISQKKDCGIAHAVLTLVRSTVIGDVNIHAIQLAENSIFYGLVKVARRQLGCMRFCYARPASRTPRRYSCQPDLAVQAALGGDKEEQAERVQPSFMSLRYGTPDYCRLSPFCAQEISRGAENDSEMGAYHHLFQTQREDNLQTRLREFIPAGAEPGIIFAS